MDMVNSDCKFYTNFPLFHNFNSLVNFMSGIMDVYKHNYVHIIIKRRISKIITFDFFGKPLQNMLR